MNCHGPRRCGEREQRLSVVSVALLDGGAEIGDLKDCLGGDQLPRDDTSSFGVVVIGIFQSEDG